MIARQYGLTHREEEVLSLLAENRSFAEIESTLYIAHGTLRVHVQHLYAKLDVHSKEEICVFINTFPGARM
ncbi:MAG: LuxR C-terminal-related transcriptional regulator [Coriobacteriales bacterium]|jgi:DNA-binding CsgD family transcriptional regulator|nr:LuxR C-terminal-related transcriptional regulator [Coriobacteriales bacterium]